MLSGLHFLLQPFYWMPLANLPLSSGQITETIQLLSLLVKHLTDDSLLVIAIFIALVSLMTYCVMSPLIMNYDVFIPLQIRILWFF